jgi:hypothetical protein
MIACEGCSATIHLSMRPGQRYGCPKTSLEYVYPNVIPPTRAPRDVTPEQLTLFQVGHVTGPGACVRCHGSTGNTRLLWCAPCAASEASRDG